MNQSKLKSLAVAMAAVLAVSPAKAATVEIGFDQLSAVYVNASQTTTLANGSYFAFGSFASSFDVTTITSANLLASLRSSNWTKSFDVAFIDLDDTSYTIANATAATAAGQSAYVIYINDTLANVRTALLGSDAGVSTAFGVFTYNNTVSSARAALPRDPVDFPGDGAQFSTEFGLAAGFNNFVEVPGLGVVDEANDAIVLIPEPSTGSLLLLGAGLLGLLRRKTNV